MEIDNLEIPRGKITALIGDNSSGKTTLLNAISNADFERGNISLFKNSKEIKLKGKQPYQIARHGIGRLLQNRYVYPGMTVMSNLLADDNNHFGEVPFSTLLRRNKHKSIERARREKVKKILQELFANQNNDLLERQNEEATSLSGGYQRLLAIARLLMRECDLFLLDEPTAGVDAEKLPLLMGGITRLVKEKNKTVLMVTHDMEVAEQYSQYAVLVHQGKVAFVGDPTTAIAKKRKLASIRQYKFPPHQSAKEKILEIKNLSGGYQPNNPVFENLNLTLHKGETLLVTGKNGTGKSTLARCIMNHHVYRSGEILYKGISIFDKPSHEITCLGLGYFIQGGQVYGDLSIDQNLNLAGSQFSKEQLKVKKKELKKYFSLFDRHKLDKKALLLSGGDRHALALSLVLLQEPQLLILDEPTADLSDESSLGLYQILDKIRKNTQLSILLIEHNLQFAQSFANITINLKPQKGFPNIS